MPYWRLSGFYLFYFASLGALIPYWGLYLQALGFVPSEIGELMALVMFTRVIAPNFWGWVADITGKGIFIVRLTSILAVCAFVGIFWAHQYIWLALFMTLFSFFWNAALPQFEAVTLNHLQGNARLYSRIRLWGSVGFILAVGLLGPILDRFGVEILPIVLVCLFAAIWVASLLVPSKNAPHESQHIPLLHLLKRPYIISFLIVCFLMQASHGPYYTFFSIYLQEHNYSSALIGGVWALGVIAEVCLFLGAHYLLAHFTLRQVILMSLFLTAVRWLLIAAFVEHFWLLIIAQLLHAASFGSYHLAAIALIQRYFTGRNQGRGQALYSSLSFGAGGAVGSLCGGYFWLDIGSSNTYWIAAAMAFCALIIAWIWVDKPIAVQNCQSSC